MLTSYFPFPTWLFDENNGILPREMGSGNQMRILATEVPPSGEPIAGSVVPSRILLPSLARLPS